MTKDYYKILGVKETASIDEIRDRWIELMREFHPDQARELRPKDQERVREINEAYEVLKHSSSRVEYDLKKTYGKGKKRFAFRRILVPVAICVILGILGAILFSQPRKPSSITAAMTRMEETNTSPANMDPKPESRTKPAETASKEKGRRHPDKNDRGTQPSISETVKGAQARFSSPVRKGQPRLDKRGRGTQPESITESMNSITAPVIQARETIASETNLDSKLELRSKHVEIVSPEKQRSDHVDHVTQPGSMTETVKNAQFQVPEPGKVTIVPDEVSVKPDQAEASKPVAHGNDTTRSVPAEKVEPAHREIAKVVSAPRDEDRLPAKADLPPQGPMPVTPKLEPIKIATPPGPDQTAGTIVPVEPYSKKLIISYPFRRFAFAIAARTAEEGKQSGLMADEAEIRQFFVKYRDQYILRDAAGFLRLFSVNAIQNRKQKINDVRKIYENFFNESQDLKFLMGEVTIEIYRNAVEVKANYRVDQVLKKGGERKIWNGPIRWVLIKENGDLKVLHLDYQLVK